MCWQPVECSGFTKEALHIKEFHTDIPLMNDYFMLVHTPHCFGRGHRPSHRNRQNAH
jgi:hypothetical protein